MQMLQSLHKSGKNVPELILSKLFFLFYSVLNFLHSYKITTDKSPLSAYSVTMYMLSMDKNESWYSIMWGCEINFNDLISRKAWIFSFYLVSISVHETLRCLFFSKRRFCCPFLAGLETLGRINLYRANAALSSPKACSVHA